ncbi:MAG TPA: T9SS type A sorting domain-containing protein [Bacteroidetes bacterium]|nr:hypothetical protein BMS3Bbin04_01623 [bacterium BMS3Bbin04]HDO65349.1 T9SS type A sorting domain-containing protein [Bacteroidota bacterium]HEX04474.1 T9SS type A sorting domain-containing protein [Bacteroidota bacterium]
MKKLLVIILGLCLASTGMADNVDKAAIDEALSAYEAGVELTKEQDALVSQYGSTGSVIDNAGGPDDYGYNWEDSEEEGGPVYEWIDITENGTSVINDMSDDTIGGPYPVGFTFPFYGVDCTSFYIGSNGMISFNGTYISYVNYQMPANTYPAMIAWFWDDLDPGQASDADVLYDTMVINNRNALVVSFLNWDEWPGSPDPNGQEDITAQVIMFENETILIQYNSVESAAGFDIAGCTIGIQSNSGADGQSVLYNGSIGGYPYDELALEFSTYELSDLEVSPSTLYFGSISENETVVLPLQLSATEDSPVTIDSYFFELPAGFSIDIDLPFTIQPEEEVDVDLIFAPTNPGDWSSDLWIHSDGLNEFVTVHLVAEATADNTSELTVSPPELDFGTVFVSDISVLPLQLSVNGDTPVIVDGYTFQFPTGFQIDLDLPYTLQPQNVLDVDVTFAPPSAADWSSTLWINSNATNPTVTIDLLADATTTSVLESDENFLPTALEIAGAYPNPFNASTVIKIRAPQGRTISAVIYDVRGREVHRYESFRQGGSTSQLAFEADNLPSGLYICHITDGFTSFSQKLVLLK